MANRSEEKQQSILKFLQDFLGEHDFSPSIRQIQRGCGISSTSVVEFNLQKLEKQGLIRRQKDQARTIELLKPGGARPRVIHVPVYGSIAAGTRIVTPGDSRDFDDTVEVGPEILHGRQNVFAVRVKGDSMVDDGVFDGDIVILQHTEAADDGDMVAAWLRDEEMTTLKRLYHDGGRIRLQPRNQAMGPIYTDEDNVEIQGRFVASISSP